MSVVVVVVVGRGVCLLRRGLVRAETDPPSPRGRGRLRESQCATPPRHGDQAVHALAPRAGAPRSARGSVIRAPRVSPLRDGPYSPADGDVRPGVAPSVWRAEICVGGDGGVKRWVT